MDAPFGPGFHFALECQPRCGEDQQGRDAKADEKGKHHRNEGFWRLSRAPWRTWKRMIRSIAANEETVIFHRPEAVKKQVQTIARNRRGSRRNSHTAVSQSSHPSFEQNATALSGSLAVSSKTSKAASAAKGQPNPTNQRVRRGSLASDKVSEYLMEQLCRRSGAENNDRSASLGTPAAFEYRQRLFGRQALTRDAGRLTACMARL